MNLKNDENLNQMMKFLENNDDLMKHSRKYKLSISEIQKEEILMNRYLNSNKNIRIIIYGRNSNDETIYKKYNQLINLGFTNVYLYLGGLFEWLLLQDIYGFDDFPTTSRQLDILKYKPNQKLNISYIENG